MGIFSRPEPPLVSGHAILYGLGPAQSREESLQMAQTYATLEVLAVLRKCEEHLDSLTMGRSA